MRQFVQLKTNTEMANQKSKMYLNQIAFDIERVTAIMVHQEFHSAFKEFFPSMTEVESYINGLMQYLTLDFLNLQRKQSAASVVGLFTQINPQILTTRYLATIYFQMFTNWRIPIAVKQILRRGFTLFMKNRWEELSGIFEFISLKLTSLLEAAQSNGFGQNGKLVQLYEIQDYLSIQSFLLISFPKDIEPAYESLFLLVDSLIEANLNTEGFEHNMTTILTILRLLLRNVLSPHRRISLVRVKKLFIIWEQFISEVAKQNSREVKVRKEISKWQELGLVFSQFYRLNTLRINGNFNYLLNTERQQADSKKLFQIKQVAVNAHLAILNMLQRDQEDKNLLIFQQLEILAEDLLLSLDYLAKRYVELPIYQTGLGQSLISLLIILIKRNQVGSEWMVGVIKTILLPIFQREIQLQHENHQEDPTDLYYLLEDCCGSQSSNIMLSEVCRCFQEMVQKDEKRIIHFGFEFLKYTLGRSQMQIKQEDNIKGHFPTACLMLSVVSYKPNGFQNHIHTLRQLLAQGLLNRLQDIQKAYFYLLYQSFWHKMYPPLDSYGQQFLILSIQPEFFSILSFFKLHFIYETLNSSQYSQRFVSSFLLGFSHLGNFEIKWQLLSKIICQFLPKMEAPIIIQLIEQLHYRTLVELNELFKNKNQKTKGYVNEMTHTVQICRQIATENEFCKESEQIKHEMLRVVKSLFPHSLALEIDNEVVKLICDVLDISEKVTIDQISLLETIATAYRENEYKGNNYFKLIGRYIKYSEDPVVVAKVFQMLIEAFSYYVYFPKEEWDEDTLTNFSGNLLLLQNMLLKSGDLLAGEHSLMSIITDQFKNTRSALLERFPGCTIVAKLHILIILASYFMQLPFDTDSLMADAELFTDYDACLLIYVISKLQSSLSQQIQYLLLQLLIIIVRKSKIQKEKQLDPNFYTFKYEEPLNFIIPIVNLQSSARLEFFQYLKTNGVDSLVNYLPDRDKNDIALFMSKKPEPELPMKHLKKPYLKILKKRDHFDKTILQKYSGKLPNVRRKESSDEEDTFTNRGKHKHNNRQIQ